MDIIGINYYLSTRVKNPDNVELCETAEEIDGRFKYAEDLGEKFLQSILFSINFRFPWILARVVKFLDLKFLYLPLRTINVKFTIYHRSKILILKRFLITKTLIFETLVVK